MNAFIDFFAALHPAWAAFIATMGTWLLTSAGAGLVFFFGDVSRRTLDGMLGFTGGVMIAASFWSLLAPAIEMSEGEGFLRVIPAAVGFLGGAVFLFALYLFAAFLLYTGFKMLQQRNEHNDPSKSRF